ncbi:DUF2971 domain-containing protein [Bacillus cereus]|uniref:DUF2971 domain-containing protein n=1 Tax=Bacillus cereus TaxID=1396 RepID=UPI000BF2A1F5|nr:DUF2971 domain-containing protein [Bacillus cereus]PFC37690.1 DUF2971 domain-containing protein [Bacillus cereus]PFQ72983.1 DUF2971 domain-containing protein [Bacillus cereus]PFU08921.1 DUF2971 domain-containing protein [Bacillus cereus]PGY73716.1 DUF2971 domain-containing protein [Bacillus cereus]
MGYDSEKWAKRILYRTDLSCSVYHLTKDEIDSNGNIVCSALDRLLKIIRERKINGSSTESGFIIGDRKAVCFQDAPIHGIVQNVVHEHTFREELCGKVRYVGFGLAFSKAYIYKIGGRPVIYEKSEVAKNILNKTEWWRIVDFDLSRDDRFVDWTHEREWRLPTDEFYFDVRDAVIILPNMSMYREFMQKCNPEDVKLFGGIIQISPLVY